MKLFELTLINPTKISLWECHSHKKINFKQNYWKFTLINFDGEVKIGWSPIRP